MLGEGILWGTKADPGSVMTAEHLVCSTGPASDSCPCTHLTHGVKTGPRRNTTQMATDPQVPFTLKEALRVQGIESEEGGGMELKHHRVRPKWEGEH